MQIGAECQQIGVVVPPSVFRSMLAPRHHAANARYLVRGNCNTYAAATDQHADGVPARDGYGMAHRRGKIGVIDARQSGAAVVDAGVSESREVFADLLFEFVPAVVAAEVNFYAFLPTVISASRLAMNTTIRIAIER